MANIKEKFHFPFRSVWLGLKSVQVSRHAQLVLSNNLNPVRPKILQKVTTRMHLTTYLNERVPYQESEDSYKSTDVALSNCTRAGR